MKIDRIRGKYLFAVLDKAAIVDLDVCRKITDLCRTRRITEVGLAYPLWRLDEVMPFMREVATITGRPVQGFSHDERPTVQ